MIEKIKVLTYAIFAYLNLDVEAFGLLMILMCVDSVLGVIKALRLKETFRFKTLLWGMILKLCFLIIPLTVAVLGKTLGYDFHIAVSIVMSILSVAEGYSILGNIYVIKNKERLDRVDIISALIRSIRNLLKALIDNLLKKLETI
jgi:small basic protein